MVFLDEVKNASGALFCEYDRPFWLVYSKNKHVWCKFLNKVANYEVFKKKLHYHRLSDGYTYRISNAYCLYMSDKRRSDEVFLKKNLHYRR